MNRVIMIGRVSCGKTTLCQRLVGDPLEYKKTQTVEIIGQAIDTPGEYAENRRLMRGLTVTAVDADLIVFLQSCVDGECSFSPGQASMFGAPWELSQRPISRRTRRQRPGPESCWSWRGFKRCFLSPV